MRPVVGILGFQGCIEPHEKIFELLKVDTIRVRSLHDLSLVDRLILPGGESTTMLRFIKLHNLAPAIQEFAKTKPVWGICAGAILAATEVYQPSQDCLHLLNISAHRNYYGSQLDSFTTELSVEGLFKPLSAQFIRAPLLSPLENSIRGEIPEVLSRFDQQPVFFSQGKTWACSFHVELGNDTSLHELFLAR